MSTRREFLTQTAAGVVAAATATHLAQATTKNAAPAAKELMKTYQIAQTDLAVSRIGYGCMQIGGSWDQTPLNATTTDAAVRLVNTAYDNGITLFDHADLYCFGKSEQAFGEALKRSPGLRNKIVIQSKCGIRGPADPSRPPPPYDPQRYDNSREYIVKSAEGSLKRLGTDRLDIYLLHRPDALVQPEEVAKAFDDLHRGGKVRYFGVSNHTAGQIALLKKYVRQPIIVNQVRVGLLHSYMIEDGLEMGLDESERIAHTYTGVAGVLDYCRLNEIQVQAYHPLQDLINPPADAKPEAKATWTLLQQMAQFKATTPAALALAWVLRHPAGILALTGPTKPEYIVENCAADRVELTHAEWYSLFWAGAGAPA